MPETGRPFARPGKVIVVEQRPGRGPVQLLPPLLIVLGGLAFLTYRSTQADWQGLGHVFERSRSRAQAKPAKPADTAVASVPSPEPAPQVVPGPVAKPAPAAPEAVVAAVPAEAAPKAAAKPEDTAAWDDIRRESEATERRLAELQREKEEASRKLADSEARRRQEARNDRRRGPGLLQIDPEQLLAAHRELHRQLVAQAAEIQRRQVEEFAAMRERFQGGGGPAFGGFPPEFGPPLRPRAGRPGEGFAEVREFRGNNGVVRFHMRWRSDQAPAPREPGLEVDPRGRPID